MTGPKNAIVGEDFGTDLPEMRVPEQDLTAEKNMARFSKSEEFKKLKEHFDERIKFYQTHLPNGDDVQTSPVNVNDWVIANAIINEFNAVLEIYKLAREVVEENVQRERA